MTTLPEQAATVTKPARARAPREFFGALFETVLDEIERNPAFAEQLAERLAPHVTVVVKSRRKAAEAPPELVEMDLAATLEAIGQIEMRERLAKYTNAALAAFVRDRSLTSTPPSKMNKTQLLNVIVRAARQPSG